MTGRHLAMAIFLGAMLLLAVVGDSVARRRGEHLKGGKEKKETQDA